MRRASSERGTPEFQKPPNFATKMKEMKIAAIDAASARGVIAVRVFLDRGEYSSAPAGQPILQVRQEVHSADRIVRDVETGRWAGQFRVHLWQLRQRASSLRILYGERSPTIPSSAP